MPTSFMGSGTKYLALEEFLMDKTENITLTFIEINENTHIFRFNRLYEKIIWYDRCVTFKQKTRFKQWRETCLNLVFHYN